MRTTILTLATVLFLPAAIAAQSNDFSQVLKFYGSQTDAEDRFGRSIDTDDGITAIGSHEVTAISAPGAVTVFRGCASMTEQQVLSASDGFAGDEFGAAVAVDGDTIVVGSPQLGGGITGNPGAAYVYRYDGTSWNEVQKLTAPVPQPDSRFGCTVALEDDVLAVGASDFFGPEYHAGRIYVFAWDGLQWTLAQELSPGGSLTRHARLGFSLAIGGDRIVAGLPGKFHRRYVDPQEGSAYVYRYNSSSSRWVLENELRGRRLGYHDYFGQSVAVHGDTILVGAVGDDDVGGSPNVWRGAVYVFHWDGVQWAQTQKLVGSDSGDQDLFGDANSVAIEWPVAVVGASGHDEGATDTGALYVFRWDGTQFTETEEITANDAQQGDRLHGVALAGGRLLASASHDDDRGNDAGAAYIFAAPTQEYGAGLVGSGGFTPRIELAGNVTLGGNVTLEYRDFLGGVPSYLFFGVGAADMPILGGNLLVDLSQTFVIVVDDLPGNGPGQGDLDVRYTIPTTLACPTYYLQAVAPDPGAPSGVSMSNGLVVFID